MTNKEKYKQAFSAIHISDDFTLEVSEMKHTNTHRVLRRMAASFAACLILFAGATTAYAADVGGIQRIIQLWVQGEQTDATIEFDGEGNYELEYTDDEGHVQNRGGGGVAFDIFGRERPATEEELIEHLTAPQVIYEEDGTVWVYWFDQKVEITDKFKNDICYVKLVHEKEEIYMTVEYQNGWTTSLSKFETPAHFN